MTVLYRVGFNLEYTHLLGGRRASLLGTFSF